MKGQTKQQLVDELAALRQRISELEASEPEHKRSEKALLESEARWYSLTMNSPDHILALDMDLNIQFVNYASPGLTLEELIGTPLYTYLAAERQSEIKALLENVLETGEPARYETKFDTSDGGIIHYESLAVPRVLHEKVVGLVVTARDITERKRAEEELKLNESRLNSLLEISQMAHELSEQEIVQMAIEEAVKLTGSEIGYLHFVNPDRQTIELVTWSERTKELCVAAYDSHYPMDQAGVWADCVRSEKPVVHNDYQNLADKKGYPAGHVHLIRHVSVAVLDEDKAALIVGVGNKETDYDETDVRQLLLVGNQLGRILQRKRSEEALRRRMEELAVLHAIAMAGAETTSLDTLLELTIMIIGKLFDADAFGLGLVDEGAGVLRVHPASVDISGHPHGFTIPLGQGVTGQVAATGRPRRIPDVTHEPAYLPVTPGMRSELSVPLKVGQRVIGILNAESRRPNAFSEDDERLMMTFAGQLTTAIEKVRLFEAEHRRAEEAETLRQAGAAVVATLQQEEAVERILHELARVVPYGSAAVQLLREGYVENVGGRGWPDSTIVVGLRFPVPGDNPNTIVIQQRQSLILPNAPAAYADFLQDPHTRIRSWLGVPLIVRGQVIGMLALDSEQQDFFTSDHSRLAAAFADQVAIAIENARLFRELQYLAITDSLTGLFNRGHFFELAKREFARARRYQHALSALMLDIDRFKRVNDTYGHAAGDQVLRVVAERCQGSMRSTDVLGRYGGEEFVALLPETALVHAQNMAERLRVQIAQPALHDGHPLVTVTASLGIALLDVGCTDLDTLLQRADEALYAAKRAGRDCVRVWQG